MIAMLPGKVVDSCIYQGAPHFILDDGRLFKIIQNENNESMIEQIPLVWQG